MAGTKRRRTPRIYKNQRGVLRRDELFEIIQCSMENDGWKDLTLRQIASGAGVSVGVVSHHFAGRDDIARSFHEDVLASLASHVRKRSPAPIAVVLREFMEHALDEHAFIGSAYADSLRLALRTKRPLPCMTLVFAELLKKCTDVARPRPPTWLVELLVQRLIDRFMFGSSRDDVLEATGMISRWLASLDGASAELQAVDGMSLPSTQIAGTPWHDNQVRRSLALGLPSRNPRRIRDARRRSGEGV